MRSARLFSAAAVRVVVAAALSWAAIGCERDDMRNDSRLKPMEPSPAFADGTTARPIPPGTVARGDLRADAGYYTGKVNGKPIDAFPMPVDRQVLARGQERFNIYCSVCHGYTGDGRGMIVQRGFVPPPSLVDPRLMPGGKDSAPGHFYDVISNGWGAMYSYSDRVAPADRWAIVAYVRALQLSQNADRDALPRADQLAADRAAASTQPTTQATP